MTQALALTSSQINRVLKTCLIMPSPEMKRCVIVLSHSALRVTEIALVDTKTIMYASGEIKSELHLPSKVCKNLKSRTVWLSPKSKSIIQEWVNVRLKRGWGTALNSSEYQGLNPKSKFIMSSKGSSFSLQPKRRKIESGEKIYWAADSLEQAIRFIYQRCGLKTSSHCGRRSLATNSVLNGVPLETVQRILGHSSPETSLVYVQICESRIKDMLSCEWI